MKTFKRFLKAYREQKALRLTDKIYLAQNALSRFPYSEGERKALTIHIDNWTRELRKMT